MYAVIETGGKQYRVEVGTELQVELLEVEPGKTIILERVLLVTDGDQSSIGRPIVPDAAVSAQVVRQIRGEKLISFKYRPKARSRVKKGHRQELTVLRISDITLNGKSAAKSAEKAEQDAKTERQRLEEVATAQAARDAELAAKLAVGSATPEAPPAGTKAAAKARTGSAATKAKAGSATDAVVGKPGARTTVEPTAAAGAGASAQRPPKAKHDEAPSDAAAPRRPRTTRKDE